MRKNPRYKSISHLLQSYLARGHYAEQIKRWLSFFPRKQILIIDANDLRKTPERTMNRVFAFLGLPHFVPNEKYEDKKSQYPPMNPETRKWLSEYYRPSNKELEELLGVTFNWD